MNKQKHISVGNYSYFLMVARIISQCLTSQELLFRKDSPQQEQSNTKQRRKETREYCFRPKHNFIYFVQTSHIHNGGLTVSIANNIYTNRFKSIGSQFFKYHYSFLFHKNHKKHFRHIFLYLPPGGNFD